MRIRQLVLCGALYALSLSAFCDFVDTRAAVPFVPSSSGSALNNQAQIQTSHRVTCALRRQGGVYCWGGEENTGFFAYPFADGVTTNSTVPVPMPTLPSGIAAISLGEKFGCALTTSGGVKCWGPNAWGQVGDGTGVNRFTPVPIAFPSTISAISVGSYFHACALTTTGAAFCWGENGKGAVGNGTTTNSLSPVQVSGLSSGVVAISAGAFHTCALMQSGAVMCWGEAFANGSSNNRLTPGPIVGLPSNIVAISAGDTLNCAITATGAVWCWVFGSVPVMATGLPPAKAISSGGGNVCAITTAGALYCWGNNRMGVLGTGGTEIEYPTPQLVMPSGVASVAVGDARICAVTETGIAYCWGAGGTGDGTLANRSTPVVVLREGGPGTVTNNNWYLDLDPSQPKTIPADKTPAFLLVANGDTTASTLKIDANVQFRAGDVGKSIHVFAYAPQSLVKRDKDTTPGCVLSQLTASGLQQVVSASSLAPYVNGVAGLQQQAVNVLNNVSSGLVAGATFCIGAGNSGTESVADANNQCAATIPSSGTVCLPPSAGANMPGVLSGLWWNSSESGWGINFTQRSNVVFAAWYTYDFAGNPKWYVAPHCALPAATPSGHCTESLYEVTGPVFFGSPFHPEAAHVASIGTLNLNFTDSNAGSMTYSVAGQTRTVAIARQPFPAGSPSTAINYTDLWWNPSESGWGVAITHQSSVMFLAWYVYDSGGKPVWYVAPNCAVSGNACTGTLYRTTGPAFGPTFNPAQVQVFPVGSVTLTFTDANNAQLVYTVNNVGSSKPITRQLF